MQISLIKWLNADLIELQDDDLKWVEENIPKSIIDS